jgi:NADPH:quinone reductase-like Zn-dependent oxidoreductase
VPKDEQLKNVKPGERAIALHSEFCGGFAEELIVSSQDVFVVDNSMSFEDGASLTNSYATALLALTRRAEVKEGDTVLINGAGGRVGLAAVDLAANVYRCKVIAVCASDERASILRDLGAFATVVMGEQDLISEVKKFTDGKGVKIIIDTIGGEHFKTVAKWFVLIIHILIALVETKYLVCSFFSAADESKIVVAGFASKKIPQFTGEELMEKSFSIIGVSLEQYRKRKYDVYKQAVLQVIEMSKEGLIKPHKAKHFPLENVNEALKTLKDKDSISKYVLDIP